MPSQCPCSRCGLRMESVAKTIADLSSDSPRTHTPDDVLNLEREIQRLTKEMDPLARQIDAAEKALLGLRAQYDQRCTSRKQCQDVLLSALLRDMTKANETVMTNSPSTKASRRSSLKPLEITKRSEEVLLKIQRRQSQAGSPPAAEVKKEEEEISPWERLRRMEWMEQQRQARERHKTTMATHLIAEITRREQETREARMQSEGGGHQRSFSHSSTSYPTSPPFDEPEPPSPTPSNGQWAHHHAHTDSLSSAASSFGPKTPTAETRSLWQNNFASNSTETLVTQGLGLEVHVPGSPVSSTPTAKSSKMHAWLKGTNMASSPGVTEIYV